MYFRFISVRYLVFKGYHYLSSGISPDMKEAFPDIFLIIQVCLLVIQVCLLVIQVGLLVIQVCFFARQVCVLN